MSSWAKLGRAAAASATAAAAATASQPTAQARAPPQAVPRSIPVPLTKSVDAAPEGWLLAEVDHSLEVAFRPYSEQDINEAIEQVVRPLFAPAPSSRPSTVITEVTDGSNSPTSEGTAANWAMEDAELQGAQARLAAAREAESRQLDSLLKITSKLLRRPGLQQEVVKCMLEDEEVRTLMLRESADLDGYLEACGIRPNISLLPPAAAATADPSGSGTTSADGIGSGTALPLPRVFIQELPSDSNDKEDVVAKVAAAVASWLERTGSVLNNAAAFLGGWLRDRLDDVGAMLQGEEPPSVAAARRKAVEDVLNRHGSETDKDQQHANAGARQQQQQPGGGSGSRRRGDAVLGGVMMLAVVVFCVMLARRPLRFRRFA